MRTLLPCVILPAVAALAGCQPQYTAATTQPQPMTAAEKDFESVWQAGLDTLRTHYFEIDRQDRRAGVITTRPMTGMHFFELWRKDAARPTDLSESTLQTIYRTAVVTVRPVKEGAETYQALVEVLLRRSNAPTEELTGASQVYGLYADKDRGRRAAVLPDSGGIRALENATDLGNDRALEAKLTAEIAAAADRLRGAKPAPAAPTTAPAGGT